MPPSLRWSRSCCPLVAVVLMACDASPSRVAAPVPAPREASAGRLASATFDPQPEPPGVYRFAMASFPVEGASRGSYAVCGDQGAVDVRPLLSTRAGELVQLTQSWSFVGPTCRGTTSDRCAPSISVTLRGAMNVRTGAVVLDGVTDKGVRVHVDAKAGGASGPGGIAGEVMFDPQPDPPKICLAVG